MSLTWLGGGIFLVTYLLISARRLELIGLDRPALAFAGAVAYVVCGILSPEEALAAVNAETLLLLFSVMGMGCFLALDGFFEHVAVLLTALASTPARLLAAVVWGSGLMAMFITNDAVCILGAPLVVRLIECYRLPALPFLLALASGANTGSVATLIGNPQNMLCGLLGGLAYRDFFGTMGPLAVASLAVNHVWLWWLFRRELYGSGKFSSWPTRGGKLHRVALTLVVIAMTVIAYWSGADMAWTAAAGFAALMLLHRRDTRQLWPLIDWSILLFFAGLFIVVAGLMASGLPQQLFARFPLSGLASDTMGLAILAAVFCAGSNLVSNVPFIVLIQPQMVSLSDPRLGWELLAMTSTFAGNLTLLGSVANVIVAEAGQKVGGIGFWSHLRLGLPLTLTTVALGTLWLSWRHNLLF